VFLWGNGASVELVEEVLLEGDGGDDGVVEKFAALFVIARVLAGAVHEDLIFAPSVVKF